ncbi:MAG: methyltransferase domain-containing protein [Deltaproteobacteria bacterium]|nr:methyltransferase domain-containing protein [Deltaproteobacteria bacterium]
MKRSLIDILVCPFCLPEERRLKEDIHDENHGDIISGELVCEHCGRSYPVHDSIAFLQPEHPDEKRRGNRYETGPLLSSYLWSHYSDILNEEGSHDSYIRWADLMDNTPGMCLDIGCAVGRFAFEMSRKSGFVIGIDNSISFIRAARELMINRRKDVLLVEEGNLTREETLTLPVEWELTNVEFIVADALALPFCSGAFSTLSSLNIVDKVPFPMKHLTEVNRTAQANGAQFLFSDPFSWSREAAEEEEWLGGRIEGNYSGWGMDNIIAILKGLNGNISPAWTIKDQGYVWWKIRSHHNYFELIRSCFIKAVR